MKQPLVGAGLLLGVLAARAVGGEPAPLTVPQGFRAEVLAERLGAPRALAVDPAGVVLASLSSAGRVVALVPVPDGRTEVVTVASGLQLPHGLAFRHGDLYIAETGRVLRFRYDTRTRLAQAPVTVVPDLPAGAHHWTRSIAFGPDGRLYVAIGSSCDICREADARRAAIVSYAADGSDARIVATGLRNPVGLAFRPATGQLWTTVNERDWRAGGAPPDYITAVPAGAAFGWPDCYARDRAFRPDPELSEPRPCHGLTPPTLELPPHSAPLGMAFHRGSLFVALHGSRPELPAAGYTVLRVSWDARGRAHTQDFATGWRDGARVWGRPVDVVAAGDALYVSDDHGGRVVRITRAP